MPDMKITFTESGKPDYEVFVPAATIAAADKYARSIGMAGSVHLMARYLLNNLLVGAVLPQTELPPEPQAKVEELRAQLAAHAAAIEEERLKSFLPELRIGGQVVTLPQIEAQLAAEKEAQFRQDNQ